MAEKIFKKKKKSVHDNNRPMPPKTYLKLFVFSLFLYVLFHSMSLLLNFIFDLTGLRDVPEVSTGQYLKCEIECSTWKRLSVSLFRASCVSLITFLQGPLRLQLYVLSLQPHVPPAPRVFLNSLFVWQSSSCFSPYLFSLFPSLSICLTPLPLLLFSLSLGLSLLPWVMEHVVPSFRLYELLANSAFSCCFFFCVCVCKTAVVFSPRGDVSAEPHDFSQ